MREDEKYTIAKIKSGNLIVPIAILKNWFGQDLQDLIDSHRFYSIGMMSSEETYNSFTRTIEHNFPYSQPRSFSEKFEQAQWYASKKFIEESVGLLHHYMVRLNSSIYVVKNKDKDEQTLVENLEKEKSRFDKDFPTKRKKLSAYYSDLIAIEDEVISLNAARNCLVHRRGVVSKKDTNDNNSLIVKWRTIRMFEKNNPSAEFVNVEKKYSIGSTIVFNYQECMDTMYTLIGYYNVLFNKCITSIGLSEDDAFYEFKT